MKKRYQVSAYALSLIAFVATIKAADQGKIKLSDKDIAAFLDQTKVLIAGTNSKEQKEVLEVYFKRAQKRSEQLDQESRARIAAEIFPLFINALEQASCLAEPLLKEVIVKEEVQAAASASAEQVPQQAFPEQAQLLIPVKKENSSWVCRVS
jgi:hypothetical protein